MNRISISIIALLTLCSFGAYAAPKIPAAQVSVPPGWLQHSQHTVLLNVLSDLDSQIPGPASQVNLGIARFASAYEVSQGTATGLMVSPADLKIMIGSVPTVTAFVVFNSSGEILGNSFNVSSVNHAGTGRYVVNFSSAMSNANYGVVCTGSGRFEGSTVATAYDTAPTTTSITITAGYGGDNTVGAFDPFRTTLIIYGGK